jgi:hypothetical protein
LADIALKASVVCGNGPPLNCVEINKKASSLFNPASSKRSLSLWSRAAVPGAVPPHIARRSGPHLQIDAGVGPGPESVELALKEPVGMVERFCSLYSINQLNM